MFVAGNLDVDACIILYCFGYDGYATYVIKVTDMLHWWGELGSAPKKVGNLSTSSFIASFIVRARPTYDPEPASGNTAVATGALAIKNKRSTCLVPLSGTV